jgi:nucleotide-binding universal stress UspA family protein
MASKIVVGLDGSSGESRAVKFAKRQAKQIGDCELVLVYVIEWSPFSFQTPEENANRHLRREEEISQASSRVVDPAVSALSAEGHKARGIVKHGNVADLLDEIAVAEGAEQIVVARTASNSLSQRVFGSAASNLVMHASVPVTVVS